MQAQPIASIALLLMLAASPAAFGDSDPSASELHEIPATELQRFTHRAPFVDKNDDFIEDRLQRSGHQIMLFTPRHSAQKIPYGSPLRPHLYLVRPPAAANDSIGVVFKCRDAAAVTIKMRKLGRDQAIPLVRLTPATGAFVLPPQPLDETPVHVLIETDSGRWETFLHLKPPQPARDRSR